MNLCWSIFLLGVATAIESQHYATSTREMASLLQLEDELIGYMRQYAMELQNKVNTMRTFQEEWMTRRALGPADPTAYVANPLISFPLMRRMYTDVPKLLELAREEVKQELIKFDLSHISKLEFQTAATGLLRFQGVYGLNESEMANGILYGKQYNSRMSAADCLALATHLLNLEKGKPASKWLKVALDQYENKMDAVNRLLKTGRSQIYEKLGLTLLAMHDLPASRAAFKESIGWASVDDNTDLAKHLVNTIAHRLVHVDNCRGKNLPPSKSFLRCRYFREGSPFLRLAALKLEQLNIEPFIGLFHDAISPAEQEDLLRLTETRLEQKKKDSYSLEANVDTNASDYVRRIHQRIEDITGLDLEDSEPLTVSNFGIGGQESIHLDCEQPNKFIGHFTKEYRSASVLLYLSDVQMGGYASFPDLGFGFKPSRGSALVWHNTDNSGNCDSRSLQATCPVLLGNQWVARKWISGSGQWRRKSCRM
ncbi:prolyl 4-hydroxylase subunit alpha-1 isoform X2 [Drosophila santomea]|uniref:prolyl 4-hydroxylase subunit alpha-1 isoform X2 n=1 Tax=Drosophila santomea TaxID=129105 RepID=UPI001952D537|nr:prolyl 4-hydroxylase subunit alpha-1 isoform X2 [Drosophila santomea]